MISGNKEYLSDEGHGHRRRGKCSNPLGPNLCHLGGLDLRLFPVLVLLLAYEPPQLIIGFHDIFIFIHQLLGNFSHIHFFPERQFIVCFKVF